MTELRPLAVYPWPLSDADNRMLHAAFVELAPPFNVQPVRAVPGGPVRVLSLRTVPDFLCDCMPVADPARPGSLVGALRWVLDYSQPADNGYLVLHQLQQVFGPETREITDPVELWQIEEELERERELKMLRR